MSGFSFPCALVCTLALVSPVRSARADEPPPRGPAEIIKRAGAAREKARAPLAPVQAPAPAGDTPGGDASSNPNEKGGAGALPAGHPPVGEGAAPPVANEKGGAGALPAGHPPVGEGAAPPAAAEVGGDPHAGFESAPALARRPLTSARPASDLPAGTIRVHVLDSREQPVPNAEVQLGTMSQEGGRTRKEARTDARGHARFEELDRGDKQAYRVSVLHEGAKYGSTPFRLPVDQGYEVVIRRLETTRDASQLVLYVGATSVELKDERLKIVQQVRLFNVGRQTYVFPDEGLVVSLPAEALAFQAEEVMTDQRLRPVEGRGFAITGSIPPGEVTLTWGFDLPQSGSEAELFFAIPWPTYAYRVLVDAAPGMSATIDGMPAPELHEDRGRRFYVSEVVKNPGEPPLHELRIHLRGVPGPGPFRFLATGIAALVVALGFVRARKAPVDTQQRKAARIASRKAELLARAEELAVERDRGEIGPEFHAHALAELEDELAALLFEEARAGS